MLIFDPTVMAEELADVFAFQPDFGENISPIDCLAAVIQALNTDDARYGYQLTNDVILMSSDLLEDYMYVVVYNVLGLQAGTVTQDQEQALMSLIEADIMPAMLALTRSVSGYYVDGESEVDLVDAILDEPQEKDWFAAPAL